MLSHSQPRQVKGPMGEWVLFLAMVPNLQHHAANDLSDVSF
jgi:hypothetical protein